MLDLGSRSCCFFFIREGGLIKATAGETAEEVSGDLILEDFECLSQQHGLYSVKINFSKGL